ncbi:MAG: arginase [Proteobacteria bacterium]|nr:arginase [Pseudomonadota bacterium]
MKGPIRIIGVPMDLGQDMRGVNMGPGAIRYAGLAANLRRLGYDIQEKGNIVVPVRDSVDPLNLLDVIHNVCEDVYRAAKDAVADGCTPVFLGGDHSISIGTIGGVTHRSPVGVLWIDAHGDFNTPEISTSGNVHGMPLAVLIGQGDRKLVHVGRPGPKLAAENVTLIAIRELDSPERDRLRNSGINIFTMRDVDEIGIGGVARKALKKLAHLTRLHVSLDVDSLDPSIAPGVGTPVPGGLTFREAHLLMETISDTGLCTSLDIVEINPLVDQFNQTAKSVVGLAKSLFGKSIL